MFIQPVAPVPRVSGSEKYKETFLTKTHLIAHFLSGSMFKIISFSIFLLKTVII